MANTNVGIVITAKDLTAGAFNSVRSSLAKVESVLFSVKTAVAAIGGTAIAGSILKVGSSFEQMNTSMETILGSAKAAEEAMAWIKDFATETPYELKEVNDAFIKLSAYGLNAAENLRWLGDTAGAMGKPLNQAVEMVADAITGEFERLKEFGVRARQEGDQVTFAWTQNGQELTKTVTKTSEDINNALKEIFTRFEGGMKKQSETMGGIISNVKDMWSSYLLDIASYGAFDGAKAGLLELKNEMERMTEDGTSKKFAESVNEALMDAVPLIDAVAKGLLIIKNGLDAVVVIGGTAVDILATGFEKVAWVLGKVTDGVAKVYGWVGKGFEFVGLNSVASFFNSTKEKVESLSSYYKAAEETFHNLARTANEAVDSALMRILETSEAIENVGALSKKILEAMQDASKKAHDEMAKNAADNYEKVKKKWLEMIDLTDRVNGISNSAVSGDNGSTTTFGFANGGVISGGFRAFANGGVVTRPTLGLIGEGRYNEAVVPLPDGNKIPVDLRSADSSKTSGGDIHFHITALDAKSFEQYVRANPQAIIRLLLEKLKYGGDFADAVARVKA
jgi:phage tail tape-measure protein